MTQKQIAVLRTPEGVRFRVKSWANRGSSRSSHPKWPATIQRWDGSEWQFVDEWELQGNAYQVPRDKDVLQKALDRLAAVHDVEVETILYDQYDSEVIGGIDVGWL